MRGEARVIGDRFRLERALQQTPEIWTARDEREGMRVDVEVASLEARSGWNGFDRFERAACVLSSSELPRSLPRALAFEHDPDGDTFLVREALAGGSLASRNQLEGDDVRSLLRGLLEAVATLHAHDLRHGAIDADRVFFRSALNPLPVLVGFDGPSDDLVEPTCIDDLVAIAETVRNVSSVPRDLRALVDDLARGRVPSADAALARLRARRSGPLHILATASAVWGGVMLVSLFFGGLTLMLQTRGRVPVAFAADRAPLSNDQCALLTSPAGANVYALDGRTFGDDAPPADARLGSTPLVVARPASGSRTLLVTHVGHRSTVVTVSSRAPAENAENAGSCSLRVTLTPR